MVRVSQEFLRDIVAVDVSTMKVPKDAYAKFGEWFCEQKGLGYIGVAPVFSTTYGPVYYDDKKGWFEGKIAFWTNEVCL